MKAQLFTGAQVAALRVLLGKCGLAQPSGWLPFVTYGLDPENQSGTGTTCAITVSRAFTIRSWTQAVYVDTTNNGSNYWSFELKRVSDFTTIKTLNTSALSPDTWTVISDTAMALAVPKTYLGLYVHVSKTGSPGNWSSMGPAMFVT